MTNIYANKVLLPDMVVNYGGYNFTVECVANDYVQLLGHIPPNKYFEVKLPTKKVDRLLTNKLITIKN